MAKKNLNTLSNLLSLLDSLESINFNLIDFNKLPSEFESISDFNSVVQPRLKTLSRTLFDELSKLKDQDDLAKFKALSAEFGGFEKATSLLKELKNNQVTPVSPVSDSNTSTRESIVSSQESSYSIPSQDSHF